jgi:acyl-CoA thioesterase-1
MRKNQSFCLWLLLCAGLSVPVAPSFAQQPTVDPTPRLLVLGDSLSSGFGIEAGQRWVDLLQQRLHAEGYAYVVANASVTGETSRGGLSRLPFLLETHQPQILIVELGGNDGLRGFAPMHLKRNMQDMIRLAEAAGAKILLLGVMIPANYGEVYRTRFAEVYVQLQQETEVATLLDFLGPIPLQPELMLEDGIHPNSSAQRKMLERVWPMLQPLLRR